MNFYLQSYTQDLALLISAFWVVDKLSAKISTCVIQHFSNG